IRTSLSARFVPNEIFQVGSVPRNGSGKKLEIPVKRILLGQSLDAVINPDAMANPESIHYFANFAVQLDAIA
ncbi:MAG TPA: hypothetical protein VM260_00915, partial [Pirellula sp.]|nr:hypothetical protein [Pirellula sp.]